MYQPLKKSTGDHFIKKNPIPLLYSYSAIYKRNHVIQQGIDIILSNIETAKF
jgi:hypothetical protein